jgi:cell division protein FtsW (lipid II flippase)
VSTAAGARRGEAAIPTRRGVEVIGLVLALAIALLAYADTGAAMNGRVPANLPQLALIFGSALAVTHLAIRWLAPYADPLLMPIAAAVNGLCLVMIYRLDPYNIANGFAPKGGAATQQAFYTLVGLAVFIAVLALVRDHRTLARYAYLSALIGLLLTALPAVLPASMSEVNGARSWIKFAGLSIQPAEFGKLLIVSFFAAYLHTKRDTLALASRKILGMWVPRARDMGPLIFCWAFAMLVLIRETDLGVSLLFFGTFLIMLYVATERDNWLTLGLIVFLGGATAVAQASAHVMVRVGAWLHPFSDVTGTTRQIAQSTYAFAAGGILGTGLGQGHPTLVGFANNADFIIDTVGEELGLAGLTALLALYGLIVARGLKTALLVRDPYGKLLATGLAVTFTLQIFITAGGVMRLIPMTGLPMPFLAAGGSALMANWILIALLVRISDAARRPLPPAIPMLGEHPPPQRR